MGIHTPYSVPREWAGATCVVVAAGPSAPVCDHLRGRCRAIAVNNAGIDTVDSDTGKVVPARAPWADVLFASDAKWWRTYQPRAMEFVGLKMSCINGLKLDGLHQLALSPRAPYDPRPTHVVSGGNSGYQAIHVAAHFGATRILLVGFDMRESNGRRHYFGRHPPALNSRGKFDRWIRNIVKLAGALDALGVHVVNCTPGSAIRGIRTSTLDAEFPTEPPRVAVADAPLIDHVVFEPSQIVTAAVA